MSRKSQKSIKKSCNILKNQKSHKITKISNLDPSLRVWIGRLKSAKKNEIKLDTGSVIK